MTKRETSLGTKHLGGTMKSVTKNHANHKTNVRRCKICKELRIKRY